MGTKGNVITGARARFLLDNKFMGYARNVRLTEEIEYQPLEVLSNIEVEEHVPIRYRVRFSASMFRISNETLKLQGVFPKNAGPTETHLGNILNTGELSAVIEDVRSGTALFTVEQVKVATQNWSVDAGGIMGYDVDFVAIRIRDESGG